MRIMTGIIITGHGFFATGIYSAIELIAGPQNHCKTVEFHTQNSFAEFKAKFNQTINELSEFTEIVVLADLLGGTPFNVASEISAGSEKKIVVLGGVNVGMILGLLDVINAGYSSEQVIKEVIETGKSQIAVFRMAQQNPDEFPDEGI